MKTNVRLSFGLIMRTSSFVIVALCVSGTFQSCQKEDVELNPATLKSAVAKDYSIDGILDVVFDSQVVRREGKPTIEKLSIGDFNIADYDNCFELHVASESVSAAIITFNDQVLLNTADFSGGEVDYSLQLCDLTAESVLEVEMRGEPGSLLNIWLEGKMTSFVDARDGKRYKVVQIGDQIWMEENLGWLPTVNLRTEGSGVVPLYYVYGYEGTDVAAAKATENYAKFGALYNWPAVANAAPAGWHVASDEEWKQMEIFLGMPPQEAEGIASRDTLGGIYLKGTSTWFDNGNGTNSSGFNGLSCGYRSSAGNFFGQGEYNNWWTSTEFTPALAYTRRLVNNADWCGRAPVPKEFGFNVRCIRN
ncbi:FISUMP domain-containing protein [Maribellus sediminis]|uniref:FISUMP domain-containing protein n=1 Tax=Maribellus sediminis TaxID=2696285 RepID=UPI001431393A|nr:FISUMP domain-containing protein [Maribellus sediminis]